MTDSRVQIYKLACNKLFLFLALLLLVVLTQVLVLDYEAEAIFFVTWLFLALTVQHDSRISAAAGLALLVTCPILLIAEKEVVAEQAAHYAYFFLAIGVLVQLKELLLERYGWLDHKLDLSYLWRPVVQRLQRTWSTAVGALEDIMTAAERNELVRLVQILGTAGLAAVFLWAAFSGVRPSILLLLVGGAVLFPFVIWGLWSALRALGAARLLRVLLVLGLLPLAAAEMVWLHDLLTTARLTHMKTVYDFIDNLDDAERTSPAPEGETIEAQLWTIEGKPSRVLYQHPAFSGASRVAHTTSIGKGYVLTFDAATSPGSWKKPGDGVTFAVYVISDQSTEQIFATYIDPKQDEAARRWHPYSLDLGEYAGQSVTLVFETGSGPAGDSRYDWAGWGRPRLLAP